MPQRRGTSRKRNGGLPWSWLFALLALALFFLVWWKTGTTGFEESSSGRSLTNAPLAQTQTVHQPTPLVQPLATSPPPSLRSNPAAPSILTNAPLPTNNFPIATNNFPLPEEPANGFQPRPPANSFEIQLALARVGISSGPIDGVLGSQSRLAIRAFQLREGLPQTGDLDPLSRSRLLLREWPYRVYEVTSNDLQRLRSIPDTWLGKSELDRLDFETALELVAEKAHSRESLIRQLNPSISWTNLQVGTRLKIPHTFHPVYREKAAFVRIQLANKTLQAFGVNSNLLAHFPCSIAQKVDKRPVGRLTVVKVAENPNYMFNPEIFPESEEAKKIGRKLLLPPGPNNPVGVAWIGLDRPGYGIHGTPKPELVGRTESHGCFRLANWNAELLLKLVWTGMPVYVDP
ncbi:MAG: L,D-transpeptidase [Verrucomicrobiota bacterium]|nr:L,D-transpeptidase [Verrucomicrobiota bacterium]